MWDKGSNTRGISVERPPEVHSTSNKEFIKHVSSKELKEVCADLRGIYTSSSQELGHEKLEEFRRKWDNKYRYVGESWQRNWVELSVFWKYPLEMRRLIYTTNPIEAFNRSMRKVTKNRGLFPSPEALLKCLYLGVQRLEKKWSSKIHNWGQIYNQLLIISDKK